MDLVEELRNNPEAGARRLETEYKAGLLALARRLCADEGDAEELVNGTFAEVVRSIDRYAEQSAFFGWMARIMIHLNGRKNDRKSNRTVVASEESPDAVADPDADARLFREVDAALLRDAIDGLPADIRKTLVMHCFMDMSVKDIARFLALPVGTVTWRLHYARQMLAAKLGTQKPGVKLLVFALLLSAGLAVGGGLYALGTAAFGSRAESAEVVSHAENAESAEFSHAESGGGSGEAEPPPVEPETRAPANLQTIGQSTLSPPESSAMNAKPFLAATSLALAATSASAGGAWTKTPLSHQAPYPAALVGRPDNLARFAQTTLTVDGNTRTGWQDAAWKSSMTLVTNGVFDTNVSGNDEGHLYPMQTGSSAAFAFGAPARVDEVCVYSCWRDAGRCDVGVASVDVCDADGNWTSLPDSALAFSNGGASVGWSLVFADASGAPLANGVSGVRVVFGTMDNGWAGIAEIEVLGAHLGTRTVTFCDENGDPLAGVPVQTVATGAAATLPAASLVPAKPGLVFAGWDEDVDCVFEDIRPRPVYAAHVDVHGTGLWTKTAFSATPALSPEGKNLARMDGAVLAIERGTATQAARLADGEFQAYGASCNMYSGVYVAFDFGKKVRIDGVRFFSIWRDDGRVDLGVTGVDVRVAPGDWTALDGSELPFVPTSVSPGFEFVFAAPDGRPLANAATGIRIRFGHAENFYVGMPEIEVLGALANQTTVIIVR